MGDEQNNTLVEGYLYPTIYARRWNSQTDSGQSYVDWSTPNREYNSLRDEHPDWLFYYDLDYTRPLREKDDFTSFNKGYNILYPDGKVVSNTPYHDAYLRMADTHGGFYNVAVPGYMIKPDVYDTKVDYDIFDVADKYRDLAWKLIGLHAKYHNLDMVNNVLNNAMAGGLGAMRAAPAIWGMVKPGTTAGNIIGDAALWEGANQALKLFTGDTFGGHFRNSVRYIAPALADAIEQNPWLNTPYEFVTEAGFNPMSYRTGRHAVTSLANTTIDKTKTVASTAYNMAKNARGVGLRYVKVTPTKFSNLTNYDLYTKGWFKPTHQGYATVGLMRADKIYNPTGVDVNTIAMILSNGNIHGVSEDLYNAIIGYTHNPVFSGDDLLMPEVTTKVWEHFPNRTIIDNNGNYNILQTTKRGRTIRFPDYGPRVTLNSPSRPTFVNGDVITFGENITPTLPIQTSFAYPRTDGLINIPFTEEGTYAPYSAKDPFAPIQKYSAELLKKDLEQLKILALNMTLSYEKMLATERMLRYFRSPEYAERLVKSRIPYTQELIVQALENRINNIEYFPAKWVQDIPSKDGFILFGQSSLKDGITLNAKLSNNSKFSLKNILDHELAHYSTYNLEDSPLLDILRNKAYYTSDLILFGEIANYNKNLFANNWRTDEEILKAFNTEGKSASGFFDSIDLSYLRKQQEIRARFYSLALEAKRLGITFDLLVDKYTENGIIANTPADLFELKQLGYLFTPEKLKEVGKQFLSVAPILGTTGTAFGYDSNTRKYGGGVHRFGEGGKGLPKSGLGVDYGIPLTPIILNEFEFSITPKR